MWRNILALIIFLLPSCLSVFILRLLKYKIGRHCKIGFSWINIEVLEMKDHARIGHFNMIRVKELRMEENCLIKKFNAVKGNIILQLEKGSEINQFNKITNSLKGRLVPCVLHEHSIIGVGHLLDLTSAFYLGAYSILAGKGSQVWTHGFYHSRRTSECWRVDGEVKIGRNVYVGSGCIICAGVTICDDCTLGAGIVVSKNLSKEGLYVNQALRYIEFDPDEAIQKYKKVSEYIYEKQN